jgi:UDP-glucose 4-epimerase
MKVAVTGAAGKLGSAVCAAINDGHDVVGLDRLVRREPEGGPNKFERRQVDTASYEELEAAVAGCNAVVHLAAYTHPGAAPAHEVYRANTVGSYNVLLAAAKLGIQRVCLASSVNAIGCGYGEVHRYRYFPVDELHGTYNSDPYSLSKWVCEMQADSIARSVPNMMIASLRFHKLLSEAEVVERRRYTANAECDVRELWGYTPMVSAVEACMNVLTAHWTGHEVFFVVGRETISDVPSADLQKEFYPGVCVKRPLRGHDSFFDCTKAERLLDWTWQ